MAAIDSMLRMMSLRYAEALVIESGAIPMLVRAGASEPLSMPALDTQLVRVFVHELAGDDKRTQLEQGKPIEIVYDGEGGRYSIVVLPKDDGYRLTCRPQAARQARVPSQAPAVRSPMPPPPPKDDTKSSAEVLPVTATDTSTLASCEVFAEIARIFAGAPQASDLLVSAGSPCRMKLDGSWTSVSATFADADMEAIVSHALSDDQRAELTRTGSVDGALDLRASGSFRFRVNIFYQHRGLAAALRPVRTDPPTLSQLCLPSSLARMAAYHHGLVLMTGPTGSGKSTTLVALIEEINRTQAKHIITLEDPIEYEYTSRQSIVHQREVGRHVESFAGGLRAALREAPDIILLGEMRDHETISAALTAAETGHLVLATLHCGDAASAIDRIIDVFPGHGQRQVRTQLATALRAVVTQVLLPGVHGGRVPAYEIMRVNDAIANLIREDKVFQIPTAISTNRADGMVLLELTLARLVREGRISRDTARSACNDPRQLDDMIRSVA